MRDNRKVLVFKNSDEISKFVEKTWIDIARCSIEKRNRFTVALSGGKTPQRLYQYLGHSKDSLPWYKTCIFLVDERFVSFDSPDSNYAMIRENLLKNIDIPSRNIYPVPIEEDVHISAAKYEDKIKAFFQLKEGGLPEFDLIMLGIGEDGHTASLFPDDNAQYEKGHLACAVQLDRIKDERITLTLPVINSARNIIFLVTGKNKASITREILEKEDAQFPASKVRPVYGKISFLLDLQEIKCN